MRYCPKCQTNYADETYEFCLQDGTLLVNYSDAQSSPTVFLAEQQTQVSQVTQIPSEQIPPPIQPQTEKSNTTRTVLLTAFVMLTLFGGGFGAWYFLGGKTPQVVENKSLNVLP